MTPRIDGILETCLYADDLDKAEQFYSEVLGLKLSSKAGGRHLFYVCGNRMLLLFDPRVTSETHDSPEFAPPHGASGPGHVALSIPPDAYDNWRQHLAANNVGIEKEIQWGDRGRSLYFRDPSGNSLEVTIPAIWGLETP